MCGVPLKVRSILALPRPLNNLIDHAVVDIDNLAAQERRRDTRYLVFKEDDVALMEPLRISPTPCPELSR